MVRESTAAYDKTDEQVPGSMYGTAAYDETDEWVPVSVYGTGGYCGIR